MRVADEEDLDVAELEAELLDAGSDERDILLEIAVDQDVPFRRGDQIVRESFAADVVEVAGDSEWRKWLGPIRTCSGRLKRAVDSGWQFGFVDLVSQNREHLLGVTLAKLPVTFGCEMQMIGIARQTRRRNDI